MSIRYDPRMTARLAPVLCRALLGAVAIALFARRAWHGFGFLPFGDEQGHLLGAQAIHAGDRLYRGFVDAHGPMIFALVHAWGMICGFADLRTARAIPVIAALLAAAALLATPGLRLAARATASATWLGLIATVWIVQGLSLVSYFPVGGALLVAMLALHAAPAGACGPARAALAGLAGALAVWTAYAFLPTVAAFALAGLLAGPGSRPAWFAAGFVAGILAGIAWLLAFADPLGLLAFHVAANQLDYARYVHFTASNFALSLRPSLAPTRIVQTLGIAAFVVAAVVGGRGIPPARRLLVLAGILALDARGLTMFQDGAFLMVAFAAAALALARIAPQAGTASPLAPLAGLACIALAELAARHAIASPSGLTRAGLAAAPHQDLGPSDDALSRRVRALTTPTDRVLALPYDPGFFTAAGRLPIAKYHDYLPWEADYARHPWFGRDRDLCVDLPRERPKVIRYERWSVWGTYDPDRYMACVPALLRRDYVPDPTWPDLWIRRDLPKR